MEKKTCLYDRHVALGALMSPFGGFIMPIQYSNITDEHNAVRQHCGVFDVSHMGAPVGQIYYGMMLYPNGGTVDDLLVYKMGEGDFFLVINAANIDKDVAWMKENATGFDIKLDHQSDQYGQLAVQGPEAEAVVLDVLGIDGRDLKFYTAKEVVGEYIISRTGYTGEDGFEIYGSHEFTQQAVGILLGKAGPEVLFLQLLGHVGHAAAEVQLLHLLAHIGAELVQVGVLVGIELVDKAIPRHGYAVLNTEGEIVGEVTTGYHCLSVDKSVCMALVKTDYAKLDTPLSVQIRKKVFEGKVVKKKFYDKHYKK